MPVGRRAGRRARSTPTRTASSRPCSTCSATRSSSPHRARSSRSGRSATAPSSSSAVRDEGRGIPEDKLDSIFARFQQVDSSDAREKGGSGLGLAISRSIVERLGGRIWADNNPAGGATFLFTLPVPADQEAFEPVTTQVDVDRGRPARLEPTR